MTARRWALFAAAALLGCAHEPLRSRPEEGGELRGQLQSVDPFEQRLTIVTPQGSVELHATANTEVVDPKNVGWSKLSDLRPGDELLADYAVSPGGLREASRLVILDERPAAREEESQSTLGTDEPQVLPPAGGLAPMPAGRE